MQNDNKKIIMNFLRKYITDDYILLDLPYFMNIGDILIWESSVQLLKEIKQKCLYSASQETYHKISISESTIIVLMGGGNFGDLWPSHQLFRRRVLMDYPNNPIVQLPQSINYNSKNFLKEDIVLLSTHKGGITLCCRDQQSFDFASKNFSKCGIELIPDMVLSLSLDGYKVNNPIKNALFVKRNDIETLPNHFKEVPANADIKDWPYINNDPFLIKYYRKYVQRYFSFIERTIGFRLNSCVLDFLYKKVYKKRAIELGISFLSEYSNIYTTRLHVGVLGSLIGRNVYMYDNSYKKISGVFDLWMQDYKKTQMMH